MKVREINTDSHTYTQAKIYTDRLYNEERHKRTFTNIRIQNECAAKE